MAPLTENPKLPVQHSPVREGHGCDQLIPRLADMRGHGGVPGYPYHPEAPGGLGLCAHGLRELTSSVWWGVFTSENSSTPREM